MRDVGWNLLLAAISVALGYLIAWGIAKRGKSRRLPLSIDIILAVAWLLFLPNSCYLLTEWRHLVLDRRWDAAMSPFAGPNDQMYALAKWALFYLIYSGIGVLLFTLAIRPVEHVLRKSGGWWKPATPCFFCIVSFGVYLGLNRRLNSWDTLVRPGHVLHMIVEALTNTRLYVPIIVFAIVLWVLYSLADIWVDAFAARIGLPTKSRVR